MIKKDTNEEYHAHPALGSSQLISARNWDGTLNLAKFKTEVLDKNKTVSASLQKAYDFGTVQHSVILEQDLSIVKVMPEFQVIRGITAKAQKEQWMLQSSVIPMPEAPPLFKPIPDVTIKDQKKEFKQNNPAEYYLKEQEVENIVQSFEVFVKEPLALKLLQNATHIETSFYSEFIKARPDIIGQDDNGEGFMCNYKTIHDIDKAHDSIKYKQYDIRAGHEINAVEDRLDISIVSYIFLFQHKTPPFQMRWIELTEEDLSFAKQEAKSILNAISMAKEQEAFPLPPLVVECSHVNRIMGEL